MPSKELEDVLSRLRKGASKKKNLCGHEFPARKAVADVLNIKGQFIRAYFCFKCRDYKWNEVEGENWTPEYLSRLKEKGMMIYP